MEQSNDLEQGWKDSYSMKEYRANRDKLNKLALMLPKVFEQKIRVDKIPGFYLINEGIVLEFENGLNYKYKISNKIWEQGISFKAFIKHISELETDNT